MTNRGVPPYTSLCNHHFRFYFSDPKRTVFRNKVEHKQFLAAKEVLLELSTQEYEIVREIVKPNKQHLDIENGYLKSNVQNYSIRTHTKPSAVFGILRHVTKNLAILLEYTGDKRTGSK